MTMFRMAFFYYFHSQQSTFSEKKKKNKNQLRQIAVFKNIIYSFKLHPYMTGKTEYFLHMDLSSCLYMTRPCSNVCNVMAGGPNFASLLSLHSY